MASLPYVTTDLVSTVLAPNPSVGQASDQLNFFNGAALAAANMVVGQYYTVVTNGNATWASYGTLQTTIGNGLSQTPGAVYLCTSVPPTSVTGTVSALPIGLTSSILTNTAFLGLTAGQTGYTAGWTAVSFNAVIAQVAAINSALQALGLINY